MSCTWAKAWLCGVPSEIYSILQKPLKVVIWNQKTGLRPVSESLLKLAWLGDQLLSELLHHFWNLLDDHDSWGECCNLSHDVNWTIAINSPRSVVYIVGLVLQEWPGYFFWKINPLNNCGIGSVFIGFRVWSGIIKLVQHIHELTVPIFVLKCYQNLTNLKRWWKWSRACWLHDWLAYRSHV